jgi:hypothetical protein
MTRQHALGPRSRTVGGGSDTMVSRATEERERTGDEKLLSVMRESAGPKTLGHGDLMRDVPLV